MAMPAQLARGLREKRQSGRKEQRPLAECLPQINVNDLSIPRDHKTYIAPNISFRYPHITNMRIAYNMVEFSHSGRRQVFRFKRIKTGFGWPRPAFICECGRSVIKLYFRSLNLACHHCCNATYASRQCSRKQRPILQANRLKAFLEFKSGTGMSQRNRHRIKARIKAPTQELTSKRFSHHKVQLPQSNYNTRGAMHWC
jgi:hypothetical protein